MATWGAELTARKMADSLIGKAKERGVDLRGLTANNFNWFLDDLFEDGGEVRCEYFTDLAMPYAIKNGGPIESTEFDEIRWPIIERAIEIVGERVACLYAASN